MSNILKTLAAGSGGDYQISRSLRFNSADSAYLSRTPASAGNRRTWTWSGWVKRGKLGIAQWFFDAFTNSSNFTAFFFNHDDTFGIQYLNSGTSKLLKYTTQVFRDASAWYHIVVSADTTQVTPIFNLYINGVQITSFGTNTNTVAQNTDLDVNNTVAHNIGRYGGAANYLDAYLTEIHFVDGQALTPSSFGEVDAVTGVWKPIRYAGTYGTNGFHLDFSDNSNTTAATLGADSSGNGNNWTPSGSPGFSVAAGAGNDSLVDSPTQYGTDTGAGGEVRGNYCTWTPLSNSAGSLSNGNLQLAGTSGGFTRCNSTMAVSSGKWYFEVTLTTASTDTNIGIGQGFITNNFPGQDALSYVQVLEQGQKQTSGNKVSYGSALTSGDVFMCAFDLDNNKLFFGKNGTWFDSSDPAAGTSPVYTLTSGTYGPIARPYSSSAVTDANFGQRPFAYTAPSGFKALCTTNLPDPTVVQGDDYFNTVLYTGTGSDPLAVTGVGFQPDFTWIKARSSAYNHGVNDAVRGAGKTLATNLTDSEYNYGIYFKSFDNDGFTVGQASQLFNTNGEPYVAWNWKANGAGSSNTAGSIPSTVSANTTAGISIVTYTGNGSAGATVGHGLGVAPSMVIIKQRTGADSGNLYNWNSYHIGLDATAPEDYFIALNTTAARIDYTLADLWSRTKPSSTVVTLGGSVTKVNNYSGTTYVAYCFAEVEGFSKFGSYTGNGSADGPFVYTGFRPAWVLVKCSSAGSTNWVQHDTDREPYNLATASLYPNLSNAETVAATQSIDILSNGFKLRNTSGDINSSGATYIFMAFAENPFKNALAR